MRSCFRKFFSHKIQIWDFVCCHTHLAVSIASMAFIVRKKTPKKYITKQPLHQCVLTHNFILYEKSSSTKYVVAFDGNH